MRFALITFTTFLALAGRGADKKLYIDHLDNNGDRIIFIQDLETGTRCYAISNTTVNIAGYAISCVPPRP